MRRNRTTGARISLGALNQLLTSAVGVVVVIAVASEGTAAEVGATGVVLAVHAVLTGVCRSFTAELIAFQHPSVRGHADALRASLAASLLIGASAAIAVAAVAPFFDGSVSTGLWILALSLVPICFREALRSGLVAIGRPGSACVNEAFWLLGLLTFWVVADDSAGGSDYLAAWAVSAALAAVLGYAQWRGRLSLREGVRWLRTTGRGGSTLASDFVVTNGALFFMTFFVATVGGLALAGELRVAQTLAAPLTYATAGLTFAIAPEVRRLVEGGNGSRLWALVLGVPMGLVAVAAAIGLGLAAVPDSLLEGAFGEATVGGLDLYSSVAAMACLAAFSTLVGIGLRAVHAFRWALVTKIRSAPLAFAGVIGGYYLMGGAGSPLGLGLAHLGRALLALPILRSRLAEQPGRPAGQ